MSRTDDDEKPDLLFPFDAGEADRSTGVQCPKCGNDGMDGTIVGKAGQWGIKRICRKCNFEWAGGIGVQQADFSQPAPRPGIADPAEEDLSAPRYTGGSYRDPSKNYPGGE